MVVSPAFNEMYLDELNRRRAENSQKLESTLKELEKISVEWIDIRTAQITYGIARSTGENSLQQAEVEKEYQYYMTFATEEYFLSYRDGLKASVATLERELKSHDRRVKVSMYYGPGANAAGGL